MDAKNSARVLLRLSVSGVFLWFGISQLINPALWSAWLPGWAANLPVTGKQFILFNGSFEVILALLLVLGLFTRVVAAVLSIHLFIIAFSLGYNDIGIRDAGLALATLSVALSGMDPWCIDARVSKTGNRWLKRLIGK